MFCTALKYLKRTQLFLKPTQERKIKKSNVILRRFDGEHMKAIKDSI